MAEKVLNSLYYLADKLKKAKGKADKLWVVILTLTFGLTPVGSFYPFGWSYFLATEKHDWLALIPLCFCCVLNGSGLLGVTLAIGVFAFKKLIPYGRARPLLKLGAGAITACFLCMAELQNGVYSMARGIASLSLVPAFTFLYGLYLTPAQNSGTAAKQAGLASIMFTMALFMGFLLPWSAPVQTAVLFITLVAARDGGMLCGGFFGFALGLSCGAGFGATTVICGLCTGLLFSFGAAVAVPIGCLAGLCTGLYFYGADYMPHIILCFFVAGAVYFILGGKVSFLKDFSYKTKKSLPQSSPSTVATAFSELSKSALIAAGGRDSAARTAEDYAAFSSLLTTAKRKAEDEENEDDKLSETAEIILKGAGVHAEKVKVKGHRCKRLTAKGIAINRLSLSSEQLKELLGHAFCCNMKQPEFRMGDGKATLYMESAPAYRIECSRTALCKKGEKVSGDSVSFFSGNGYFYSLISDGMGSGKEAAVSSRLASVFLEKLLLAGADRYSSLSLLNNYLASRENEVFATVDLLEADLYTGKAVLLKAGAAPSLLMRGGRCKRLEIATAPTGIIREISAKQLSFNLKADDVLVMFSDGVCGD